MNARILDGQPIAARLLRDARRLARLAKRRRGRAPRLAIVCAAGPAALSYAKAQLHACSLADVEPVVHRLSPGPRSKTLGLLADIAADSGIDAIAVSTPYPRGLRPEDISATIPASKDVEGLTAEVYGRFSLAKSWNEAARLNGPCTALALARIALEAAIPLSGRSALVIGRSNTVGRPVAHLLSILDLTVTLAHSLTRGLPALCRQADVLVAAAGRPGLIRADWIKRGALVLDAGVSLVGGRLTGDVSAGARARAAFVTPVPGGAGPVTTAQLILQAARLAARSRP